MTPSEIEPALPEPSGSLALSRAEETDRRFANLRGVRWRINLGVLPSFASSIDEFRRATANSRRRLKYLSSMDKEMVSSVQHTGGYVEGENKVWIGVSRADGSKCERYWNYSGQVGSLIL